MIPMFLMLCTATKMRWRSRSMSSSQRRSPMAPKCSTSRAAAGDPGGDPLKNPDRGSMDYSARASRSSRFVTGAPPDTTPTKPTGMCCAPFVSSVCMRKPTGLTPIVWASMEETLGATLSLMLGLASDTGDPTAEDEALRGNSRVAAMVAYYPPVDLRPQSRSRDDFPAATTESFFYSNGLTVPSAIERWPAKGAHGFPDPENRARAMDALVNWFEAHLAQ